ncbi:MAG: cytochrome b/b6 domain-containing protein [Gammaproteobacteria bacterium]
MSLSTVRVWDLPVRLFHWAIVALLGYSWWSGEEGGMMLEYHMWSGYAVLTLVLFRVLWGFAGSGTARFADFVRGPAAMLASLRELWSARPLHFAGHNPLGGWMVLALLACLLVQTLSGLFANDDLFNEGPLYKHVGKALSDTLTGVHHLNFGVLLALVALHVAAVAWHRLRKGERLVGAMIHGRKSLDAPAPVLARAWRALPWLALSAGVVAIVVNL